jgi:endonuclease III
MAKPRGAKARAQTTVERLAPLYPGSARELCALKFNSPFQLLVATILSAQTTDERVNMTTPGLFARFEDAAALAAANPGEVEELVKSTGFFRNKAKSIIGMASALMERHGGEVPDNMDELVELPGVGRKTANVVLSVAFGKAGLPVDTHVTRLSKRLKLTNATDAVGIESDLCSMMDKSEWGGLSLRLILHGRRVCIARKPDCANCVLADFCPSADPA